MVSESFIQENSVPLDELSWRCRRLQAWLQAEGLAGALLVQRVDVYYWSGTAQDAHVWIPAEGMPLVMVRKHLERARADSPLEAVVPVRNLQDVADHVQAHSGPLRGRVGMECDVLPVTQFVAYQRLFPHAEIQDASPGLRQVRMIKSTWELTWIQAAAAIADHLLEAIPGFLKRSRTETDLAVQVEAFYRTRGHPGLVRFRGFNAECVYGHILSGTMAALPGSTIGPTAGKGLGASYPQGASLDPIVPHTPILVDYAASVEGYLADQSRVFSMGPLPDDLLRAHEAMVEIQAQVAEAARPGVLTGELHTLALGLARAKGYAEDFMGHGTQVPFVGHGLGLELDEWPVIGKNGKIPLEANMVIALEPKVVFPGRGVLGVEDTFVVTEKGMRALNTFPRGVVLC